MSIRCLLGVLFEKSRLNHDIRVSWDLAQMASYIKLYQSNGITFLAQTSCAIISSKEML